MAQRIQIRKDTSAIWTNINPILANGEIGLETDTKSIKIGNGTTEWNSLVYYHNIMQKARAYCSTAQSIPNAINTKVAINTKSFDPSGIVDTTNSRIKPTKAGYYQVNGQVNFGAAGDVFCSLFLNGNSVVIGNRVSSSGDIAVNVNDIIYLNGSSDYIELYVFQGSGASANLSNWGSTTNYLSIVGPF